MKQPIVIAKITSKMRKNRTKYNKITKKSSTIKTRLILSYILCAIVPLVVVNLFSSSQSKLTLKETTSQMAIEMVKQTSANVSYYTDDIEKSIARIILNDLNSSSNNLINDYMTMGLKVQSGENKLDKHGLTKKIITQLNYSSSLDDTIDDIALMMEDGTQILSGTQITSSELEYFSNKETIKGVEWYTIKGEQGMQIYALKEVVNIKTGKKVGVLVLRTHFEALQEKVNNISLFEGSKVSILNASGEVICSNTEEEMSEEVRGKIDLLADTASIEIKDTLVASGRNNNNWVVVAEIPQRMLTERIDGVVNIVWLIVVIMGLIAVVIGEVISRNIVYAIKHLKTLMQRAEEGDLTVIATIQGNDEMTELGKSFNNMMENIKRLLEQAKTTIEHSLESADILSKSSQHSIEGFAELAGSIGSIAEGSNSQTQDIQKSSVVMDNLSNSIEVVMENTLDLLRSTHGTREIIEDASSNMMLLNTTVASTHEISGEISQSIMDLNVLTRTIGEIMKLLDDISERTNLLALNATIESARAGAAGKGFAVVADEVRKLSVQSKTSSNHVKEALKGIETKVVQTSRLVVKSNRLLETQGDAVNKTSQSLELMIEGLKKMNKGLEKVSSRIEVMTECKNEMSTKIENIAIVNEENAAAVEQLNALSEEQCATVERFANLANDLVVTINGLEKSVETFVVAKK